VDDIVLVGDDAIKQAMRLIYRYLGRVAEPAGAVAVAALLCHTTLARGVICAPITGGNVNQEQMKAWVADTR